jgi:hypothetical protein
MSIYLIKNITNEITMEWLIYFLKLESVCYRWNIHIYILKLY